MIDPEKPSESGPKGSVAKKDSTISLKMNECPLKRRTMSKGKQPSNHHFGRAVNFLGEYPYTKEGV